MGQPQLLMLSDVTLGYAVPQMIMMARALGKLFGARVTIVEPDMKGRNDFLEVEGIDIRRISTRNPPHDPVFYVEYARAINTIYREIEPDVLVVFNAAVIPPLLLNLKRPKFVLYYMLESIDHQLEMGGQHFFELNRMATELIDLVVVPERRRFAVDAVRLIWEHLPVVEVLNIGSETCERQAMPARCRFLFAGTLSHHTGFDWLMDERIAHLDIDVAGPTDSEESRNLLQRFLSQSKAGARRQYLGLVPHAQLLASLHEYAFRMVFWTATDINTLYASPNKFFESISYCLPPVSTPHPQMIEVNRRYRCSLLSKDFSKDAMVECLLDAERIFHTNGYARLLAGCRQASADALNWPAQFRKVALAIHERTPNGLALPGLKQILDEGLSILDGDMSDLGFQTSRAGFQETTDSHGNEFSGRGQFGSSDSLTGSELALTRASRRSSTIPVKDYTREREVDAEKSSMEISPPSAADVAAKWITDDTLDPDWYLIEYQDVVTLGMSAEEHYVWLGKAIGRFPNAAAKARHYSPASKGSSTLI